MLFAAPSPICEGPNARRSVAASASRTQEAVAEKFCSARQFAGRLSMSMPERFQHSRVPLARVLIEQACARSHGNARRRLAKKLQR